MKRSNFYNPQELCRKPVRRNTSVSHERLQRMSKHGNESIRVPVLFSINEPCVPLLMLVNHRRAVPKSPHELTLQLLVISPSMTRKT